MMARNLRLALVGELLLLLLLASWGVNRREWSIAEALLLVIAAIAGLRLAAIGITFAFSIRHGTTLPSGLSIGPLGAARVVLKEVLAYTLLFTVFQPFERYWMGADRLGEVQRGRLPVLLVHGYFCNRGTWVRIARALHRAGWPVATLNLEPPGAGIDDFAEQLAHRIQQIQNETGAPQVILVGHSMGGLVARRYLERHGEFSVRALITLATPHHGTELARLGIGRCARQMEPGSRWLSALPDRVPVPFVSIYSAHDNFVMPQGHCTMHGVRNVALSGVGHIQMVLSQRVTDNLLRELAGVA